MSMFYHQICAHLSLYNAMSTKCCVVSTHVLLSLIKEFLGKWENKVWVEALSISKNATNTSLTSLTYECGVALYLSNSCVVLPYASISFRFWINICTVQKGFLPSVCPGSVGSVSECTPVWTAACGCWGASGAAVSLWGHPHWGAGTWKPACSPINTTFHRNHPTTASNKETW